MTTPIYLVAPKPHLGQHNTLAQRLHDMVVSEELKSATSTTQWSLNTSISVPFDIWQPLPARHNFHTRYSPAVRYGYTRVHTSSLFSPQDEILESCRERSVTQPIGSRTSPKPVSAPSTSKDPQASKIAPAMPYKTKKVKRYPVLLYERGSWRLRSLRSSQRLEAKHGRYTSYIGSITPRAQILGE